MASTAAMTKWPLLLALFCFVVAVAGMFYVQFSRNESTPARLGSVAMIVLGITSFALALALN